MKAIRIHFADNGDELRVEEVPQLDPKPDEVLISTQAIGVNRADLNRRRTVAEGEQEPPRIPGLDVAGVVESVGADVNNWHPGDQVIALVRGAGENSGAQGIGNLDARHANPTPGGMNECRLPGFQP